MNASELESAEKLTLEEFEELPDEDGYRHELVRGRLVREPPPGAEHGWLSARLFREIDAFARERGLGLTVFPTGFLLNAEPPTVRGPDIAFLAEETLSPEGIPTGYWRRAPDLAIEILSPSNRAAEMQQKILDYLDAGARLVWIVDPRSRCVSAYRSRNQIQLLREGDVLEGADVLPGFRLALSELFAPR